MNTYRENITVFHYTRWYPNRYDPMFGLFIKRHAEAVAIFAETGVIYAHPVTDGKLKKTYELDYRFEKGVHTARVYYLTFKPGKSVVKQTINIYRYFKANYLGRRLLVEKLGKPDIHHVHILTRPAVIAFFYHIILHIPYVVSEHWSRYLRTGSFTGNLRKSVTRMVVKSASAVTTVTKNLANAMQENHRLTNRAYSVLANVVDPIFYRDYPKRLPNNETTFVHVSCFEDQSKNISGLLRVARLLNDNGHRFKLILIGEGMDFDSMVHYATDLGLKDNQVVFTGLLQGKALVKKMLEADALVVSSHYENLPVVIIEGMALGLPVISTRVGGIDEIVDTSNGCLVTPGDEQQLAQAMAQFIEGSLAFNPELIKDKSRATYSSEAVGEKIAALYQNILQNR